MVSDLIRGPRGELAGCGMRVFFHGGMREEGVFRGGIWDGKSSRDAGWGVFYGEIRDEGMGRMDIF